MNCPEHLVFKWRTLFVWMYWRDVRRDTIPLRIWLNPLRYEVSAIAFGRRRVINRKGMWASRVTYAVKRQWCRAFGHRHDRYPTLCDRCRTFVQSP